MKLMFASDIHGSAYYAQLLKDKYLEEKDELGLSSFEVEALTYFKSNYSL